MQAPHVRIACFYVYYLKNSIVTKLFKKTDYFKKKYINKKDFQIYYRIE